MIKKSVMVLGGLLLSLLSGGLAAKDVTPYVANFSYTPDSRKAPASGGVTFTMRNVVFSPCSISDELWLRELGVMKRLSKPDGKLQWFLFPQFAQLSQAMNESLSGIFLAKGFSVRGPFDSYDSIPYQDKKATDLYLIPKLDLVLSLQDETTRGNSATAVEVNGTLTLEIREVMTQELLWTKKFPLEKFEFSSLVRMPYYAEDKFNLIMNDVAKGLEQQYSSLMGTISGLIDPQEMRVLKKQAQGLKTKKGY